MARLLHIAAGGTGGHMFPAQALAEAMVRRGWQVELSTDERGQKYSGGFPHVVRITKVASATFARGGLRARLAVPLRIFAGIRAARRAMRDNRPSVVIGFGGYPTVPALAAAWLLGIRRLIHEQNAVPGRVNRFFARRVHAFACGSWPTALPGRVRGTHTGNPVRAAVKARAGAPYVAPGPGPISLVVIGGSQGARILSDVVPDAVSRLPAALRARLSVIQQARTEDVGRVTSAWHALGIPAAVSPFFEDIGAHFAGAQLVIARAGASTLADLTVIGRPSILIPYAAATGDHQTANALALVDAGAAILVPEAYAHAATLATHIGTVLENPVAAAVMAARAREAGVTDATERLVALIEGLVPAETGARP